jgi:hypothetical protein
VPAAAAAAAVPDAAAAAADAGPAMIGGGIPRSIFVLSMVSMALTSASCVFNTLLPIYMVTELKMTMRTMGMFEGMSGCCWGSFSLACWLRARSSFVLTACKKDVGLFLAGARLLSEVLARTVWIFRPVYPPGAVHCCAVSAVLAVPHNTVLAVNSPGAWTCVVTEHTTQERLTHSCGQPRCVHVRVD